MQQKRTRRANADRTRLMRARLLEKARDLFVERGYHETSTPEIAKAAKVTRGALYHHFEDKLALFRAVVEHEADTVASAIKENSQEAADVEETISAGSAAYFDAMRVPGRTRLLLVDGPSVLGSHEMSRIFALRDGEQLRLGLEAAIHGQRNVPFPALADVLSAAFDRAALSIAEGGCDDDYRRAISIILAGLVGKS